jgi:hypothetical protein
MYFSYIMLVSFIDVETRVLVQGETDKPFHMKLP